MRRELLAFLKGKSCWDVLSFFREHCITLNVFASIYDPREFPLDDMKGVDPKEAQTLLELVRKAMKAEEFAKDPGPRSSVTKNTNHFN